MYKLWKLYYNGIDISEGIDVNNLSESKKSDICCYWYIPGKEFNFQPHACSGCSYVIMMSLNLSNIAILNISSADYCYIINGISKNQAINLPENTDLNEKMGTL